MTKKDEIPPLKVWLITFILLILSAICLAATALFVDDIFLLLSYLEIEILDFEQNNKKLFATRFYLRIILC